MLKDSVRTLSYRNAIMQNPQIFKGKTVLDVSPHATLKHSAHSRTVGRMWNWYSFDVCLESRSVLGRRY